MSWLTNVVVVGTPVDGIATVKIPLPGSNMTLESNFRQTAINLSLLEEETPTPPIPSGEYLPTLSSVKW